MLHVEALRPTVAGGPGAGSPLVLLHGFTQNARCWGSFGELLGRDRRVLAVDAPGHGRSGHDDADLTEAARLAVAAGGRGHYVGYSMGGRIMLHALLMPEAQAIESLVLIGATAGIDDPAERDARRREDDSLADELCRVGTEVFVDRWLRAPLFAALSDDQACRSARLANRPEGLAASLRHCGTGTQQPLWHALAACEVPVLVIAGTEDRKFTELGRRLVDSLGAKATFAPIAGSHAVHLENPDATAAAVLTWLEDGLG